MLSISSCVSEFRLSFICSIAQRNLNSQGLCGIELNDIKFNITATLNYGRLFIFYFFIFFDTWYFNKVQNPGLWEWKFSSVQFSSVAQSCPTLCDPMNRSTPGLPVHHHLPEFTQTHVHRVSDAIYMADFLKRRCQGLAEYCSTAKILFYFYWRLITLPYCSIFCHTLTQISHGCVFPKDS